MARTVLPLAACGDPRTRETRFRVGFARFARASCRSGPSARISHPWDYASHDGTCTRPEEVTTLKKTLRAMAASGLALLMVFSMSAPAFASTLSDKRARAATIQRQIELSEQHRLAP